MRKTVSPENFYFIIIPLLWLALSRCSSSYPQPVSKKIADVYRPATAYDEADQLKYKQDFGRAAEIYEMALKEHGVSVSDSLHLINQMVYCRLIVNRKTGIGELLNVATKLIKKTDDPAPALQADLSYNQARYYFLQQAPDSARYYAHQALRKQYRHYPRGHLKTAQTLSLLSLIHLKDGHLTDSIHYYALQTNNYFLNHPELKPYDWENDYVQGNTCLLNRAHEVGEYHCRAALKKIHDLPFENPWLEAWTTNLLGRMVRKRGDGLFDEDPASLLVRKKKMYGSADSIFQKAMALGRQYQHESLLYFYWEWIITKIWLKDEDEFYAAMKIFYHQFADSHPDGKPFYHQLLAYYYFKTGACEKSIEFYRKFLEVKDNDPNIDYRALATAYFVMRECHEKLGNFDRAAHFAKKSFLLYRCLDEEVDITRPEAVTQLDSSRLYSFVTSGFFAQGLLKKYRQTKDPRDLLLANTYFDFVERHSFQSLLKADEDTFLTFQLEAGNRIFINAIEAAREAWALDGDPYWLEKAFNYMEYLKSYLLYRDMLKNQEVESEAYSLSDSIRILQGQVNQVLYRLGSEEQDRSDDLFRSNLVNTLSSLENRRKETLDALTTDRYRSQVNISKIRSNLAAKQGIVNYYNGNNQLFGIYIDADTAIFYHVARDYDLVLRAIEDYRNSIEQEVRLDETSIETYLRSARVLYRALIQPFEDRLGKIDQLLVVPDQLLDPVPFEAFLCKDTNGGKLSFRELPYLLHRVQIIYTSSWKVYEVNRQKIRANHRDHSIGFWTTPQLNASNGLEVIENSIRANFGNNYEIFSQRQGGKQLFAEQHQRFDIIHLLLHAGSSRINRYDNQIRFGEGDNNTVYGFELYKQKFNAKLLVLASCESATGAPRQGEGTFSLARSFINSGIPEIVAAQFLIPQTTTGPLLSNFYKNLGRGQGAARALHEAKVEFLRSVPKERHAYPRFWAGMVLFN